MIVHASQFTALAACYILYTCNEIGSAITDV